MGISGSLGFSNKKLNSTSKLYSSGASFSDALLKEPCDIHNPVLQIEAPYDLYSYMEISTYNAFYWVDRVVSFPNGIIEVHAHLDPLATYQAEIYAARAYACFGSFSDWNQLCDDPRLFPEMLYETSSTSADVFSFTMSPNNGTVIMTVFQCGAAGDHGVRTYALSIAEFRACLLDLPSFLNANRSSTSTTQAVNSIDNAMANITSSYTDDVKAQIASAGYMQNALGKLISGVFADLAGGGSWRDNILNAVYVPIPKSAFTGTPSEMYVGTLDCGERLCVAPSIIETYTGYINVPWGPHTSSYKFLRIPKYQQLQIVVMGGYYQTIDGTYLMTDKDTLSTQVCVHSTIDICSGDWAVSINKGGSSNALKLATFSGNCGINITGALGKGGTGQIMQTLNTIGQFAAGAATAGTVTGLLHAGENFATARDYGTGIQEKFSGNACNGLMSGSCGGGIASMFLSGNLGKADFRGILQIPKIIDDAQYNDYCNEYGWPVNNYVSVGGTKNCLLKCSGASVICSGTQSDIAYINSTLNSGILIED